MKQMLFRHGMTLIMIAGLIGCGFGAVSVYKGNEAGIWKHHSVILAKVLSYSGTRSPAVTDRIQLRLMGTLAGRFDCGRHREVDATALIGDGWPILRAPVGSEIITVIYENDEANPVFEVITSDWFRPFLEEKLLYPDRNEVLYPLRNDKENADAVVDRILASIQKVYPRDQDASRENGMRSSAVVYARVKDVVQPKQPAEPYTIVLLPKVTLSGDFDTGATPECNAKISVSTDRPKIQIPGTGAHILVALAIEKHSVSVQPGRVDFMPGDHSAICEVKNFDDPRVLETLKAVQVLRKKDAVAVKPSP